MKKTFFYGAAGIIAVAMAYYSGTLRENKFEVATPHEIKEAAEILPCVRTRLTEITEQQRVIKRTDIETSKLLCAQLAFQREALK